MFSLYNFTLTLIILAILSLLVAYSDIACSGASILFYHLLIRSEVIVFYENKIFKFTFTTAFCCCCYLHLQSRQSQSLAGYILFIHYNYSSYASIILNFNFFLYDLAIHIALTLYIRFIRLPIYYPQNLRFLMQRESRV